MKNLNYLPSPGEIAAIKNLSNDARADLAARINSADPFNIFDSVGGKEGKEIICPNCGSGSGKNHTGIKPTNENGKWLYNCFACGSFHGDLISIIAAQNNLDARADFFTVLAIGAKITAQNISTTADATYKVKKFSGKKNTVPAAEITEKQKKLIAEARKHISYLYKNHSGFWRGIDYAVFIQLNWGVLPNFYFAQAQKELPAVIIPNDKGGIFARAIEGKFYQNDKPTATTTIYLPNTAEFDLLIVEGAITGASILQTIGSLLLDFGIIASGGTSGNENVISRLQELKSKEKKFRVIVAYDNDSNGAGQKASAKLLQMLIKSGFTAAEIDITKTPNIDLNDVLRQENGAAKLKELIYSAIDSAQFQKPLAQESALKNENVFVFQSEETDTEIDSLKKKLQAAKEKLSDFESEKDSAVESLQAIKPTDSATALAETVIQSAAFAKVYSITDYHEFYQKVKNGGAVNLVIWQHAVNNTAKEIKARELELKAEIKKISASLDTKKYTAADNDLKKFVIPAGYSVTEKGVAVEDKQGQLELICAQPLYISAKYFGVDTKFFKWNLKFKLAGKKKEISAIEQATLADATKIIPAVANYGLLVDSTNAKQIVKYLTAFSAANENKFPLVYTSQQLGWHNFNGKEIFLDPRRNCEVEVDGVKNSLVVDSQNWLAEHLKTVGKLEDWRRADELTKGYPVARFIVAAALTAPLLKVLNLRSFAVYLFGSSRAGKTSALLLAVSAVGGEELKLTFNGTSKGFQSAAIESKDFPFFLDERQAATGDLSENLQPLIYNYCEETERIRAARNGTLRKPRRSKGVMLATGEAQLYFEGVTEGALTRTLQLALSGEVLPKEICAEIRRIIKTNYGHILPLFLDKLLTLNVENLREEFKKVTADFVTKNPAILPEHCADVAAVTLAYRIKESLFETDKEKVRDSATEIAAAVFKLLPTKNAISDYERAKEILIGFIIQKARNFVNSPLYKAEGTLPPADLFGRFGDEYCFLTGKAFELACRDGKIDVAKTKKLCIDNGLFALSARGQACDTAAILTGLKPRCYRIPMHFISGACVEIDESADIDDVDTPFD